MGIYAWSDAGIASGQAGNGAGADGAVDAFVLIDDTGPDNPAGLSKSEVDELMAGGPLGDMRWLYPYEGTVFPRGTAAPLAMWNGALLADAVYLHIKSQHFEYKGILNPAAVASSWTFASLSPGYLPIPQAVWEKAGAQTRGREDPFTLELSERIGGQVRGPVVSHITIAQAQVKGSIYYSSCLSLEAVYGSKIFRIPPGGEAQLLFSQTGADDGRCQGCHTVSADGSRLLAQHAPFPEDLLSGALATGPAIRVEALSYLLDAAGAPSSMSGSAVGQNGAYAALYPDGSKYLSSFAPSVLTGVTLQGDVGLTLTWGGGLLDPLYMNDVANVVGQLVTDLPATLRDATTGEIVPDTGIPAKAAMPTFSPDGKHLVFTDFAVGNGHALATMDYDTRSDEASNYKELLREDTSGELRPGWPFFSPDDRAVLFARTKSPTFTSGVSALASQTAGQLTDDPLTRGYDSDLYIADVASGRVTLLAQAMGFRTPEEASSDSDTYLPFGAADLHNNYFPTVSPVAAGGYFWVFFDSLRHFGSLGALRALWGFAIDVRPDGTYATDPSHPPFVLPGQRLGTANNHRAFAALDKCKPDGARCATGIDCCAGSCLEGLCSSSRAGCAAADDRCTRDADCCLPAPGEAWRACIANFCAPVLPAP